MGPTRASALALLILAFLAPRALGGRWAPSASIDAVAEVDHRHHHHEHPFSSPPGLFIQERASKQLPGPGQHFSFGALVPWEQVHEMVQANEDAKLLLVVRHGQAVSNFLSDFLGPDEWFKQESKCSYTDDNTGTTYKLFDAELTELGQAQAQSLNSMLGGAGWFEKLTGGNPTRLVVSPLSRCLQTALLVTNGLQGITGADVDENARETLGEDTCDARRSVSDPGAETPLQGPCEFDLGLSHKFPQFQFQVSPYGLGMKSDKDEMWTKDRETQKHQTKRATQFLYDVFDNVEEKVVLVVTHSGFTRSVLLAVDREPYRPQNTELVPIVIYKSSRRPHSAQYEVDVEEEEEEERA